MSGTVAPGAIEKLWTDLDKRKDVRGGLESAVLSGIVGDVAHSFGYHLSPEDLRARGEYYSDYSLETPRDRHGAVEHPHAASAIDISLDPKEMIIATHRLLHAAKHHDPRVHGVREFCGTLNGRETYPWDLYTGASEGVGSWDDSHLWHVHISFYRDAIRDYASIKGVADVLLGTERPAKKKAHR